MTNLENAKNALDGVSYETEIIVGSKTQKEIVVPITSAFYALALASETDWKYPAKNELPDDNLKVLCYDKKGNAEIGKHKKIDEYYKFIDNAGKYFYCEKWRELPKFKD